MQWKHCHSLGARCAAAGAIAAAVTGVALVPTGAVAAAGRAAPVPETGAAVAAAWDVARVRGAGGLVPGVRAGAVGVQAPKCRRQSSSVMSGVLGTAAGGT
jgi:hypothetical protein